MSVLTHWQEHRNAHYVQQEHQILTVVLQLLAAVCNALLEAIQSWQVPLLALFACMEHFQQQ